MAQPYIGEIRLFAGNFAPNGWMFCEGQLLPIAGNDALFILLGTAYGGDGQSTFALPDLRGRVPLHMGQGPGISNNYILAESGGVEEVTLTVNQIPIHNHPAACKDNGSNNSTNPQNAIWNVSDVTQYTNIAPNGNMVRLAPEPAAIVDEAPSGRLHLDGQILVSEGDGFARARRSLSFAGCVGVTLVLESKGRMAADPVLHMEGMPEQVREAIVEAVGKAANGHRRGGEEMKEEVRRAARRAAQEIWGKKPVVRVETVEV